MDHTQIKDILTELGEAICQHVHHSLKTQSLERLSAVHKEGEDDTIYQIDKEVEDIIVPALTEHAEKLGGIVLIAEGVGETEKLVLPEGMPENEAALQIIMDPIDGTRGIMYDKRSAFFLAGAALNQQNTSLQNIEVAVMVELPTSRAAFSDTLWAIKGQGAHAYTRHLEAGKVQEKAIRPSQSATIYGGFAQIARFFPPGREVLAAVEERMLEQIFPDAPEGKTIVFEDQYISSGGQLYEILMGHDRFVADIRAALFKKMKKAGKKTGHVCHPYDVCTILIGQEAGVIITDIAGNLLNYPLDTSSAVNWVAYANEKIKKEVEGAFQGALGEFRISG